MGHLLKDCNEKELDEEGDSSNLNFGPWMRANPNRARPSFGRKASNIRSNQRMIFKPLNLIGKAEQYFQESQDKHMMKKAQGETLEIGRWSTGKETECLVVTDSGTSLNDTCLSKEQARVFDMMLDSIFGWHI